MFCRVPALLGWRRVVTDGRLDLVVGPEDARVVGSEAAQQVRERCNTGRVAAIHTERSPGERTAPLTNQFLGLLAVLPVEHLPLEVAEHAPRTIRKTTFEYQFKHIEIGRVEQVLHFICDHQIEPPGVPVPVQEVGHGSIR